MYCTTVCRCITSHLLTHLLPHNSTLLYTTKDVVLGSDAAPSVSVSHKLLQSVKDNVMRALPSTYITKKDDNDETAEEVRAVLLLI